MLVSDGIRLMVGIHRPFIFHSSRPFPYYSASSHTLINQDIGQLRLISPSMGPNLTNKHRPVPISPGLAGIQRGLELGRVAYWVE